MSVSEIETAVDAVNGAAAIEASGGVTELNAGDIARARRRHNLCRSDHALRDFVGCWPDHCKKLGITGLGDGNYFIEQCDFDHGCRKGDA